MGRRCGMIARIAEILWWGWVLIVVGAAPPALLLQTSGPDDPAAPIAFRRARSGRRIEGDALGPPKEGLIVSPSKRLAEEHSYLPLSPLAIAWRVCMACWDFISKKAPRSKKHGASRS
jgi:hypothetical protein